MVNWNWKEYKSPQWVEIVEAIQKRNDPLLLVLFEIADDIAEIKYHWGLLKGTHSNQDEISRFHNRLTRFFRLNYLTSYTYENFRIALTQDFWPSKPKLFSGRIRYKIEMRHNVTIEELYDKMELLNRSIVDKLSPLYNTTDNWGHYIRTTVNEARNHTNNEPEQELNTA